MDEIDFIENDIYIVKDSSFGFNTEIIRVVWDTETDDDSTSSNGITYTNGRFVNQDGNKITTYSSKIGSIAVYDKDTLMTGISEKLSGTFNSNNTTKTNASTNSEIIIRDGSSPGHYDVYAKFTLTNNIVRGTDYVLPGGSVSITYNP